MDELTCIHGDNDPSVISYQFSRVNGSRICVEFDVQNSTKKWFVDERFNSNHHCYNWGLWENDVFEVFIQGRSESSDFNSPYLEVQVSPLGQGFSLYIIDPRKIYLTPLENRFDSEIDFSGQNFKGKLNIDLESLGDFKDLYGGFYSILGPREKRSYYAHHGIAQEIPDFHQPELFIRLD